MKHRLRQHFWAKDGDPGPLAWLIAVISLVLPVLGLVLCLVGGATAVQGRDGGWLLLGLGASCIVLDLVIDFVWAHPGVSASDQPQLNRRGDQLAGRMAVVVEAIEDGHGKVRVGDTLWPAEGPDAAEGAQVRIVGNRMMALLVESTTAPREPTAGS